MDRDAGIDAALAAAMRGEQSSWQSIEEQFASPNDLVALVWGRIAFHGISSLLNASAQLIEDWPDQLLVRLGEEARIAALWEATHQRCIANSILRLDSEGVKSVVMKGTALAYSLYTDPAHRRRGDTDLLIRSADLERARSVLSRLGWRRRRTPHGLFFQETWLFDTGAQFVHELDLHWQPHDRPTLQAALRCEEYLGASIPIANLCEAAQMPSLALTMMHTAINQAWHEARGLAVDGEKVCGGKRLIWAKDCDLIARKLSDHDWQELTRLCGERGASQVVNEALQYAETALGTPVPKNVLNELTKPTSGAQIFRYLCYPSPVEEFRQDLRSSKGLKAKLLWIAANAKPDRTHLERKFPGLRNWPTIALLMRYSAASVTRFAKTKMDR